MNFYVARNRNGVVTMTRMNTLGDAKDYANRLYRNGVVAPLVVAATDVHAATRKAVACYEGPMTCRQARDPKVTA